MAIQYSGGTNRNDLYAGVTNRDDATANINTTLVAAGWTSVAMNPFTVLTFTANPLNNETVTLNGQVYTFKTVINNANNGEILIGIDSSASAFNFRAAVNLLAGAGTLYSSATTINTTLQVSTPSSGVIAFPYSIPGAISLVVEQIAAGAPVGYAVSETLSNGGFSVATVIWRGYKCTSALTPQGLQCKWAFYNAGDANVIVRCIAMNPIETEISNSFAGGETLFVTGSGTVDIRVIANKYQCFVMPDNTVGNSAGIFWAIGAPWIPDFLTGLAVSAATNATPIVITTTSAHGLTTGDSVTIRGVGGNIAANVTNNLVTVLSGTTFSLDGVAGTGVYTSGGRATEVGVFVVEAIWAQGCSSSTNFIRLILNANAVAYFTALNGSSVKDGSGSGSLRIASVINDDTPTTELTWFNASNLVTEPFLCFGTAAGAVGKIIGQLWDAVVVRKALTRDVTGTFDSHNWWNLTDNNTGGLSRISGSVIHVVP